MYALSISLILYWENLLHLWKKLKLCRFSDLLVNIYQTCSSLYILYRHCLSNISFRLVMFTTGFWKQIIYLHGSKSQFRRISGSLAFVLFLLSLLISECVEISSMRKRIFRRFRCELPVLGWVSSDFTYRIFILTRNEENSFSSLHKII